ncbi:hypothetical protein MHK_008631 [Candidatus Magnetomorum sp. HK-1]|nr:hypothetical protein MHK_008631 [Candidatus Magnetomorum sp. HK-1]
MQSLWKVVFALLIQVWLADEVPPEFINIYTEHFIMMIYKINIILIIIVFIQLFNADASDILCTSFISNYWQILSINTKTKDAKVLTKSKYDKLTPCWSFDCSCIYYSTNSGEIFKMNAQTGRSTPIDLPSKYNAEPDLSKDCKTLVYTSYTNPKDFKSELWLLWFDKDHSYYSQKIYAPSGLKTFPCWDESSKNVCYSKLISMNQNGAQENICLFNINSNEEKTIIADGFDNIHPQWSPDGSYLAWSSNKSGNFDIYLWYPNIHKSEQLTKDPSMDTKPVWSSDNKKIAFVSARTGQKQIFLIDIKTRKEKQITFNHSSKDPSWGN